MVNNKAMRAAVQSRLFAQHPKNQQRKKVLTECYIETSVSFLLNPCWQINILQLPVLQTEIKSTYTPGQTFMHMQTRSSKVTQSAS